MTFVPKRYDGSLFLNAEPSSRKTVRHSRGPYPVAVRASSSCRSSLWEIRSASGSLGQMASERPPYSTIFARSCICRQNTEMRTPSQSSTYPKEPSREQRSRILEEVRSLSPTDRGHVFSCVAQLNSEPNRIMEGAATSPGELRKR